MTRTAWSSTALVSVYTDRHNRKYSGVYRERKWEREIVQGARGRRLAFAIGATIVLYVYREIF